MSKQREALEMILAVGYTSTESPTYKIIKEALAEPEPVSHHSEDDLDMVARQPLTDSELWEMWVESPSDVLRFARAIERAHGIGD